MKPRKQLLASAVALAIAMPGLMQTALAQGSSNVLEEITVTARKKEENLRDIPVAVTAINSTMIQEASITDVQSLALMSPGLSYREGFGRATGNANNRPSIRGMSSILGSPNASFFVDGIFVSGPVTGFSLENLERVEIIRGPQAATFGRGTFAGAVNFVTRRPGDESQARVSVDIGDHDYTELSGFIAGPIVEGKLSGELNGRFYNRGADPEYTNLATNPAELGAEESKSWGAKINWTPTENISIYANLNWSSDEDGSFAYGLWNGGDNDANNINTNSPNTSNCFGPTFNQFVPVFTDNRSRGYYCGEIKTPMAFWSETGGLPGVSRDQFTGNLVADFGLGEWNLQSLTGVITYDYENAFGTIHDSTASVVAWDGARNNQSFSQEVRLDSPTDRRVRFGVGLYYYKAEAGNGFDTSFSPNAGQGPEDVDLEAASFTDNSQVKNQAVFGSVDFDVTDSLVVSAEVRYQEEEIRLSGFDSMGNEQFDGSPETKFTATLPRLAATWTLNDSINLYGSIAMGNNPGDFNSAYWNNRFDPAERAIFVDSRGKYDESEVTAYELGIKGLFFDGRVNLNAALYFNDWEKQALTNSDALTQVASGTQTTVTYITNAGRSEVQGIELELVARPTDWLDVNLSYALAQSEFKDYLDENFRDLQDTNGIYTGLDFMGNMIVDNVDPDGQVAGNSLPQTPEHMANLSARLHFPTSGGNEWYIRGDYTYESKRYVQAANLAWIGAASNLNMRIGFTTDNWDFSVWGRNVTNDDTPEVVTRLLDFRQFFLIPSQVRASGRRFTFIRDFTVTAPRSQQWGANFTLRF